MVKAAIPWGQAHVIEEFSLAQRAGDKRFATIVQLLVDEKGTELVRFAYSTDGTARSPFRGVEQRSLAWGPWLAVGLKLDLAQRLALVAGADATFLFPKTVIRSAGREVTTFGRPLASGSAGLELAW